VAPLQKRVHAFALVIAIALLIVAPANSAQNDLIEASAAGDLARVSTLLAAKADVNAKLPDGFTALISASQNGHLEVVQALLAANADINAKGTYGATALYMASQNGHLEVVQALLAAKADVNAKAQNGGTALTVALRNGHLDVVQLLKKASPLLAKAEAQSCSVSDSVNADPAYRQKARDGLERNAPNLSEEDAYREAKEDNLHYFYTAFITKYPNSPHLDEIEKLMTAFHVLTCSRDTVIPWDTLAQKYSFAKGDRIKVYPWNNDLAGSIKNSDGTMADFGPLVIAVYSDDAKLGQIQLDGTYRIRGAAGLEFKGGTKIIFKTPNGPK
jgi:hypothetical protein